MPWVRWLMVDVSPYVYDLFSWLSDVHTEIKAHPSATSSLSPAFTVIVNEVFSEMLSAFRQIALFSKGGTLRANLDTKLLYGVLSERYPTKHARDTTQAIYETISAAARYTTPPEMQENMEEAKEVLRVTQLKILAKYPWFIRDR